MEDATFILEIFNSPTWLKFIGDRGVKTIEQAEEFLKNNALKSFSERGWGTYRISLSETRTAVGTVGLYNRPGLDHPDFGYALLPEFEGMGYATESCKAMLEEIDRELRLDTLLAIVLESNKKSTRLLDRLEFKFKENIERDGEQLMLYSRTCI